MTTTILLAALLMAVAGMLDGAARASGGTDPDWDGDGAMATDCRPLDPAVHPAAVDHPDLAFEDLDCDGIDGDRDRALFVMPGGSDGNVGTSNAPFQTIQKAIDVARTTTRKAIYVATGTYNQRLVLGSDADGIGIFGGYDAGIWTRSTASATTINGQPEAMILDGARDVVLQLLTLDGTRGAGLNAYGLRAINGSEVALVRTRATAGSGGPGGTGAGGSTPAKAASGDPGDIAPNCDTSGTGGVVSQPGNGTDGGAGGRGGEETNDGENGQAGTKGGGTGGGAAGGGGVDIEGDSHGANDGMHGQAGGQGDTGASGSSGSGGGSDLGAAGAAWAGRNGGDGSNGGTGYGGGGGGGGAGRGGTWDWGAGAGGGQGGDGGSGGTRGFGGGWGGGSIGVYLHGSDGTVVDGSALTAGNGGAGGAGGTGGSGGQGGNGGAGGPARTDCGLTVGRGGDGGPGGPGGKGGDGGGGSGGPSAALMRIGVSSATMRGSSLTNGTGGPGGSGGGGAGQSGVVLPATGSGPTDFDGDGIADSADGCVEIPRGTDDNGDGCPDRAAALPDGDGDGVPNDGRDACPGDPAGSDANYDGCTDVIAPPDDTTDPTDTSGSGSGSGTSGTTDTTGTAGTGDGAGTGAAGVDGGGSMPVPGGSTGPAATMPGAPSVVLTFAKQKLRKALAKGFVLQAGCAQACVVQSRLVLAGRLAKKLRLSRRAKPMTVAKGGGSAPAAGTAQVRLKFTAAARRRLARLRTVRLMLIATPSNAGGAGPELKRKITLRR